MARVKRGFKNRRRHKKVLNQTKGYRNSLSRVYRKAYEALNRALNYAFRDRKNKKRDFRGLWIQRINAATRLNGTSYSRFMNGLRGQNVQLDRKVLADIALRDPKAFSELVQASQAS